jgi:hypothetical protein
VIEGAEDAVVSFWGGNVLYLADRPLCFLLRRKYRRRRPAVRMRTTTPATTPPMRAACDDAVLCGDEEAEPACVTLK